jgi:tetratricopeptide (TPR) repeat protein
MCEIILKNHEKAIEILLKVVDDFNSEHPFAVRQIAWTYHVLTNWQEAASWAVRSANLYPNSTEHQIQTAKILSLNTIENFRLAEEYFGRSRFLAPYDTQIEKLYQAYLDAKKMLGYFESLFDDDIVPDDILKTLRPGLSFFKSYFGINTREYNTKLKGVLSGMEGQVTGSVADLEELVENVNIRGDRILRSKYLCNLGRLTYLEWYHNQKILNPEEIERFFQDSLRINSNDPFCHCWLGTYYKEVKKDYDRAEIEYRDAISKAENSEYHYEHNHPLFENNLGLLFLDKVRFLDANPQLLVEARNLLESAVAKNEAHSMDFPWPEYNLGLCNQTIEEYNG